MNKKKLFLFGFLFLMAVMFFVLGKGYLASVSTINDVASGEKIHYHAGFLVYVDGKLQDFSDLKYMHIEPCTIEDAELIPEDEQLEKAHLHSNVGDVVHVHRPNAVWGDLFRNISFSWKTDKLVSGYVQGVKIDDILNYPIKAYDSVVIVIGENTEIDLNTVVSKEHIEKAEQASESC